MEDQENSKKYLDLKHKVKVIKEVEQGKKVIDVARALVYLWARCTRYSNQERLYIRIIKIFKMDSKLIK